VIELILALNESVAHCSLKNVQEGGFLCNVPRRGKFLFFSGPCLAKWDESESNSFSGPCSFAQWLFIACTSDACPSWYLQMKKLVGLHRGDKRRVG